MTINLATKEAANMGGGERELTPSGEWLRSDVTLLREGLNNIKGRVWALLYVESGDTVNTESGGNVGKIGKGGLDGMGTESVRELLGEIYDECNRILWGEEEESGERKLYKSFNLDTAEMVSNE